MHIVAKREGEISAFSNEIELNLTQGTAPSILEANNRLDKPLELDPEVNLQDIIELLISMASGPDDLNQQLTIGVLRLLEITTQNNTSLYGGSSLLRDTSHRTPAWYRTTSLSQKLARNLLDITSQQVVIGIGHHGSKEKTERFAIGMYNTLRALSPVVLALSASSPYTVGNQNRLMHTGTFSRRIQQYVRATSQLPAEILETPQLSSLEEYQNRLQTISDQVTYLLQHNRLDSNLDELNRVHSDGYSHRNFDILEPHQIYWLTRPRPDHQILNHSALSIEMRTGDTPLTVQRMRAINSFIAGICYYASKHGFQRLDQVLHPVHAHQNYIGLLLDTSKNGLHTQIQSTRSTNRQSNSSQTIASFIEPLLFLAQAGLQDRGQRSNAMALEIRDIITRGTDAQLIQNTVENTHMTNGEELESVLANIFIQSAIESGRNVTE